MLPFLKRNWPTLLIYVALFAAWAYDIHLFMEVYPHWRDHHAVSPSIILPTPISQTGNQYEFCKLQTSDQSLTDQEMAGTPVVPSPVPIGPTVTPFPTSVIPTATRQIELTSTPEVPTLTLSPTPFPRWNQVQVIKPINPIKNGYHLVLVGVGYKSENEDTLKKIVSELSVNFKGVYIDFAYVKDSIDLSLNHVEQEVSLADPNDATRLKVAIKAQYPEVDGIALAINTPLFLGTMHPKLNIAMISTSDPNGIIIGTHEIGHLLNLDDGYDAYYPAGELPNTELFFADQMPQSLAKALKEMGSTPPMYLAGTCNGRPVYRFYQTQFNIMGNYGPNGESPWGNSIFTPLQIQLMNDFVRELKGN